MFRMSGANFRLLNLFMLVRPCGIWMRHVFIPLFVFHRLDAEVVVQAHPLRNPLRLSWQSYEGATCLMNGDRVAFVLTFNLLRLGRTKTCVTPLLHFFWFFLDWAIQP
ncbi:hypothetical protein HDF14_001171 [Edaphobacter lichenicola]|uniref:Uncharacterized protein n=1 Tax=Tunturiibacter gelidiferens TaxID=3069689 RepID=A0A9X0QBX9_9BACT|nr:hypothetical protein [Edaphobacter lichenicola]